MLPAGFTAGAITSDVNPQRLLGAAFGPLVSLAVAVILYDAGLGLELAKLRGRDVARRHAAGSRVIARAAGAGGEIPPGHDLLFVVRADGRLEPVTAAGAPQGRDGDTMILLSPAG